LHKNIKLKEEDIREEKVKNRKILSVGVKRSG